MSEPGRAILPIVHRPRPVRVVGQVSRIAVSGVLGEPK